MGGLINQSIKDGFSLTQSISFGTVLFTLITTFVLGLFIYFIYKRCFMGVVFQKSFGVSLVMLSMVTGVVIMTISSNLMLSLGMVGALSIVRFRTAVKDPMDTIFMFWAIAAGIIAGAQLYLVAIIACAGIGLLMVVISMFKFKRHEPYIMVLRFENGAKADVQNMLRKFPQGKLRSKTVARGVIELTLEMDIDEADIAMMDKFAQIPGVLDASLVSYSGDVVS